MRLLKQKLLLVLIISITGGAAAHAQSSGNPVLDSRLNAILDSMRGVLNVKSLGAAIVMPNDAVWADASGVASLVPLVDATPAHVYEVGSVAKTFTAATILQLVDEGVLTLNDSLHEWLPSIPFVNPNITIRQVLRHQSGLYDVIASPTSPFAVATNLHYDSVFVIDNVVNDYIKTPEFTAGTSWSYCNTNYLILAMIIKAATGKTYVEQFKERFFIPQNLPTIQIPYFDDITSPVAHVWLDLNGDMIPNEDGHNYFFNWTALHTAVGPSGGYYATPTDIAKWMKTFASGSLLTPSLMMQVRSTVNTNMPDGTRYGLGIMERKFMNITSYGHGGDLGYSSNVFYFPSKQISIAVLNSDSKVNSWGLAPVVTALLQEYMKNPILSGVDNTLDANVLDMSVSPNPFMSDFKVSLQIPSFTDEAQLVLTNVLGERIATKNTSNLAAGVQQIQMDGLNEIPSGMYFLSVVLDGQMMGTMQVVK
jgi:D-alanyl-D-alanine carboxypeptidase